MIPDPTAAPPAASAAVDIRRLPGSTRLAQDYAFRYHALADFYRGNPSDAASWSAVLSEVGQRPRDRAGLVRLLHAQQARRNAPPEARSAAAALATPGAVAIVTGQQAGLFGGPLYTLFKALTAIGLADEVSRRHHVPAVAVFWADVEDHDWDEVRGCSLLDPDDRLVAISVDDPPGAGERTIASLVLDESVDRALAALQHALPPTEYTADLLGHLSASYHPGMSMADAFTRWLEAVLGARGLVVFDSSDAAAKPLVADVFAAEVREPGRVGRLAAAAGQALEAAGYHAQVVPAPDALALFETAQGREPIRVAGDLLVIDGQSYSRSSLEERVRAEPERFSPNVLLRPLVQDTIFPTACYVAGPSELAYLGQLRPVYAAYGISMPLVQPRWSATLLDSNAARFLAKHELPLEQLQPGDERALNHILSAQMPAEVDMALADADRLVTSSMEAVARAVAAVDATLEGAARSTLGRMQDDVKKLNAKVIQAAKRKDETLRRQFRHAQALAFPSGAPQERVLGFVQLLNRCGPALIERLAATRSNEPGTHWIITL